MLLSLEIFGGLNDTIYMETKHTKPFEFAVVSKVTGETLRTVRVQSFEGMSDNECVKMAKSNAENSYPRMVAHPHYTVRAVW